MYNEDQIVNGCYGWRSSGATIGLTSHMLIKNNFGYELSFRLDEDINFLIKRDFDTLVSSHMRRI